MKAEAEFFCPHCATLLATAMESYADGGVSVRVEPIDGEPHQSAPGADLCDLSSLTHGQLLALGQMIDAEIDRRWDEYQLRPNQLYLRDWPEKHLQHVASLEGDYDEWSYAIIDKAKAELERRQ